MAPTIGTVRLNGEPFYRWPSLQRK